MLVPKRAKFRKQMRGSMKGNAYRGTTISFGEFGLSSEGTGWITSRQIEAARRAITHYTQRGGRVWIRIFPDKPITKKPAETRMGKGKGNVELWVAVVKRGRVICELSGVDETTAKAVFRAVSYKLPMKTKMVRRLTSTEMVQGL